MKDFKEMSSFMQTVSQHGPCLSQLRLPYRTPETGWLNYRYLLLTVLEATSPRSRSGRSISREGSLPACILAMASHDAQLVSLPHLIRTLILFY